MLNLVDLPDKVDAFVRNVPLDLLTIKPEVLLGRVAGGFGILKRGDDNQPLIFQIGVFLKLVVRLLEGVSAWHF